MTEEAARLLQEALKLPPEARAAGLETFELPLLKAISDGKLSQDVEFRAGTGGLHSAEN